MVRPTFKKPEHIERTTPLCKEVHHHEPGASDLPLKLSCEGWRVRRVRATDRTSTATADVTCGIDLFHHDCALRLVPYTVTPLFAKQSKRPSKDRVEVVNKRSKKKKKRVLLKIQKTHKTMGKQYRERDETRARDSQQIMYSSSTSS